MWRNYLAVGVRSLIKSRTYAFINIFGLAVGLAACLMLLLFVRYEQSYDRWLPNSEDIYQLQTFYAPGDSGEPLELQMSSYAAGLAVQRDFPAVEKRVYVLSGAPTVIRNGEAFEVEDGRMVDDRPCLRGDRPDDVACQAPIVEKRHMLRPREAGHDVRLGRIVRSAREFEHTGRLVQQIGQPFARLVVDHVRPVTLGVERQDGVNLEAHF